MTKKLLLLYNESTVWQLYFEQQKEERKDRLHQNYLRRKANGKQREYEERTKSEKRKKMEEKKAALRAEDMAKGVYILTGSLPHLEPQLAAISPRTATL